MQPGSLEHLTYCAQQEEHCRIATSNESLTVMDRVGAQVGELDWITAAEMERDTYQQFLLRKKHVACDAGFEVPVDSLNPLLFDWQREIVHWALRKGKAALFENCGLGKTPQQLEWAHQVCIHTGGNVLILAPLAVAEQTKREGDKFCIPVTVCRSQADVQPGINITNYEMLEHFDTSSLAGVVLDESSVLKAHDGKTRQFITDSFARTPYRLACTATPAPNDQMELGTHAEFLGVMTRPEMLAMFFTHDGGDTSKWRLKGHAQSDFWKWVCSWAVLIQKPSDIGYSDKGYNLPPIHRTQHVVSLEKGVDGFLFTPDVLTLTERRDVRRGSLEARVAKAAELVNNSTEQWLVWCDLNDESAALTAAIPGAVEVKGSDSREHKERSTLWFKGLICECELRLCGNQNTPRTEDPNTKLIQSSGNGATSNLGIQKLTRSTCGTGTPETESGPSSTESEQRVSATQEGVRHMRPMKSSGKNTEKMPGHGRKPILTSDSLSDSSRMGSLSSSTAIYLQPNQTHVQSVADPGISTITDFADSTLITATTLDRYADSSAHHAISESGSSATIPRLSNGRQCTCGGIKNKRVLVSKPSIFGYGLNFQNCYNSVFVGLSDSFEQIYQAERRIWRFGQSQTVNIHVITSNGDGAVVRNIARKESQFEEMISGMVEHMRGEMSKELHGTTRAVAQYESRTEAGDGWTAHLGDCVETLAAMKSDSIGYSIFSPPFASLYTYSNSERDMGNSTDYEEFSGHFRFLTRELYRVIAPGRLVSIHCMNLPTTKERDGYIGIRDFRGDLIRAMQDAGFIYHSEVVIWKDPVTAMQRTKAIGLLYKQLRKDSTISRQGVPDYLLTFRKPGSNQKPVTKTHEGFPVDLWQRYASPVWMDINPSDTLQRESAREEADERHICPLQLGVIERAIRLWTNPNDLVLSPFMGIGSEGYVALKEGRRFVGVELKPSYFEQAVCNLQAAAASGDQSYLFNEEIPEVES